MMTAISRLCIPVQGFDEAVIIPFSQLPDLSPEDLLDLLMSECAPLSMWMDFAKGYLAQNRIEQFKFMLTEGTSNDVAQEVEKFFGYKPLYEQIQFYCGLAALHMQLGQDERDKTRRQQHFGEAQNAIMKAQDLDSDEQLIYLARGMLSAAKGDLDRAGKEFHLATLKKNDKKPNIVATLALAALAFNQKKYTESLNLYKKALTQNPACPPEVRLGLAACYFRLGNLEMAQKAYERVLQLDPQNTDAHLGLAVIKFNASNIQQGLANGLKQLVRAYELDPHNTAVLNTLAHFCILRGNFKKAVALANAAYKTSESDALKASCVGQLARAYHGLGDFDNAKKYYTLAVRMDQKLPLPRLGMAQMYIREGEYKNAATELESMLAYAPGCYDGLMILGKLYPQMPTKVEKTINHFKEAAAKRPKDPEARELLAELLSSTDPAAALEAVTVTLDIHRKRQEEAKKKREEHFKKKAESNGNHDLFGDEDDEDNDEAPEEYRMPAKLLNNAAVLFCRAGRTEEAVKLMEESLKEMELTDGASGVAPMQKVTLIYNMARIHEMSGNLALAREGYQSILKDFPTYIECYLRMACVSKTIGDTKAAIMWAQKAVAVEGGSADANALLATLYTGNREYYQAEEVLKKLRSEANSKHDTYAFLAQANLYYTSLSQDHKDDLKKKAERLQQALNYYVRVLSHEPRNIYAANGIGAVLAEQGHVNEAQEVFMAVQEASTASDGFVKLADVWVNLANVYLAKEDYVSAIKMYRNTSAKFYNHKNAQVLLYLSRAHYDSGDLSSAKTCLLQALHVAPGDKVLWFDVALTMQERAVRVFQNKQPLNEANKLEAYSRAVLELEKALRLFQQLKEFANNKQAEKLDPKKLSRHVDFCEQSLRKAQQYVREAERQAEVREKKRQATAELMSKQKQQRALEAENAKYAERKKKEEREEAARKQEERMAMLREQWRMQRNQLTVEDGDGQERPKKKKKSEKKKKGREEDDFIDNGGEEGEYQDNGDQDYNEAGGSGDEAGDEEARLREAGLGSDSDSGGGRAAYGGEEEERVAPKSSKKKKKKRLRHDSDAEEAGGDESDGAAALQDEFADEDVDDGAEEKSAKKKARRQTAFDDDEEEEEGEAPATEEQEEAPVDEVEDEPDKNDADEQPLEDDVDQLFDDD